MVTQHQSKAKQTSLQFRLVTKIKILYTIILKHNQIFSVLPNAICFIMQAWLSCKSIIHGGCYLAGDFELGHYVYFPSIKNKTIQINIFVNKNVYN